MNSLQNLYYYNVYYNANNSTNFINNMCRFEYLLFRYITIEENYQGIIKETNQYGLYYSIFKDFNDKKKYLINLFESDDCIIFYAYNFINHCIDIWQVFFYQVVKKTRFMKTHLIYQEGC